MKSHSSLRDGILLKRMASFSKGCHPIILLLLPLLPLRAEVSMPYFFGDGMVLQQQTQAPIWGKAAPASHVVVSSSWDGYSYHAKADEQGRWQVKVQTPTAGGPYTVAITEEGQPSITFKEVYSGEVWLLGGQSNMEMPLQGYRDQPVYGSLQEIVHSAEYPIHWFKVHRHSTTTAVDTVKHSQWKKSAPDNAGDISAAGWFFAKQLSQALRVPIGLIACNYGGSSVEAWMSPSKLQAYADVNVPGPGEAIPVVNRTPSTLFNGMLNPLIGYAIKGCLWYQGESNYQHPDQYADRFAALVADWRTRWGQGDFPFYYAQIAPYDYRILKEAGYVNSAYLREAQRLAESTIPASGMIVLLDEGDSTCIHPGNKAAVGERFALLALAKTYGWSSNGLLSPKVKDVTFEGAQAIIRFDEAPVGLSTFGKSLTGFELAGSDSLFHPATAVINKGGVVVTSTAVSQPVAVRYGFTDYLKGSLKGANGLPVSSFYHSPSIRLF